MDEKTEDAPALRRPPRAIGFDIAVQMAAEKRAPGLRVKGAQAPFAGSWIYDPQADELTLAEAPTLKD